MSSLAVQTTLTRERAAQRTTSVTRRRASRRRRPLLRRNAACVFLFSALVGVFGYVALYANLTATSFDRSRMMNEFKMEQIRNERLRIDYVRRLSPAYAMGAAQRVGMVYAKHYDYLGKSNTIAKADQAQMNR